MPQFRKRPVTIEAHQYTGPRTGEDIVEWVRSNGGKCWWYAARTESIPPYRPDDLNEIDHPEHLEISTLEGMMTVPLGFWVIRGVAGEFYGCAPEIFEQTYEPVYG